MYRKPEHEHIVVHFRYDWMNQIWENKFSFLAVFLIISTVTYGILYAADFYPELTFDPTKPSEWISHSGVGAPLASTSPEGTTSTTPTSGETAETTTKTTTTVINETPNTKVTSQNNLPIRLIIDKLDRDVKILNPQTDTVEAMDAALLQGIIRHPDSADFAHVGTMFLLGHSSYLPTVHNKNFQAFNGIQKLEWGDTVRIQSSDTEYIYRVQKVYQAKASNAEADIQWSKAELIMVTCNSFASKDDRYVVEGYLVSTKPLKSS